MLAITVALSSWLGLAQNASAQAESFENPGHILALKDGVWAVAEPRDAHPEPRFVLELLHPYTASEHYCLGGDSTASCSSDEHWYEIERASDRMSGWVREDQVVFWSTRHAVLLSSTTDDGFVIPAYCSEEEIIDSMTGAGSACSKIQRGSHVTAGDVSLFPVLDVKGFEVEGTSEKTYLRILLPIPMRATRHTPAPEPEVDDEADVLGETSTETATGPESESAYPSSDGEVPTVDVIFVVDATRAAAKAVARLAETLDALERILWEAAGIDARFTAVAFRGTKSNARCPRVEYVADPTGVRPDFASAHHVSEFLSDLRTSCPPSPSSALGDALVLARDLPAGPESTKLLVVLGAHDGFDKTLGYTAPLERGPEVAPFTSPALVLNSLAGFLGDDARMLVLTLDKAATTPTDMLISSMGPKLAVADQLPIEDGPGMAQLQEWYTVQLSSIIGMAGSASSGPPAHPSSGSTPAEPGKASMAAAPPAGSSYALAEYWVPRDRSLSDVVVLTREEAEPHLEALESIASGGKPGVCTLLAPARALLVDHLLLGDPVDMVAGDGSRESSIQTSLRSYWRQYLHSGSSIFNLAPTMELGETDCTEISNRLNSAHGTITILQETYVGANKIYLPFTDLP